MPSATASRCWLSMQGLGSGMHWNTLSCRGWVAACTATHSAAGEGHASRHREHSNESSQHTPGTAPGTSPPGSLAHPVSAEEDKPVTQGRALPQRVLLVALVPHEQPLGSAQGRSHMLEGLYTQQRTGLLMHCWSPPQCETRKGCLTLEQCWHTHTALRTLPYKTCNHLTTGILALGEGLAAIVNHCTVRSRLASGALKGPAEVGKRQHVHFACRAATNTV